ncbi:hypothetical protein Tco_0316871 [Tanacetum coccineum]
MMDVSIHQEDLDVQRTPLIDLVISMVTEKTASTPTPTTTQAHAQMCSTSCWKDISKRSLEVLVGARKTEMDKRLLQRTTQAGTPPSMCQTISNIDAHVEGEQFHESKQSSNNCYEEHYCHSEEYYHPKQPRHTTWFELIAWKRFEGKGVKEHLGSVHGRVEGLVGDVLKLWCEYEGLGRSTTSLTAYPVVVALPATAPSAEETEPFETDESAATPPPHPAYRMTARISIPEPLPVPAWTDSEIPFPVSPPPPVLTAPPPSPIRSLGYRAATIRMRAEAAATSDSPPLPPPFILSPTRPDAPPPLPTSAPTSFPPLSLPTDSHREGRPEVNLPPR